MLVLYLSNMGISYLEENLTETGREFVFLQGFYT